jgi:hypothetical protein
MKVAFARDIENFPRELLRRFPESPEIVQQIFYQGALHSEGFLEAWVKVHEEMGEASVRYVKNLAGKNLPITILANFPAADWRNEAKAMLIEKVEGKLRVRRVIGWVVVCVLGLLMVIGCGIVCKM